MVLTGIGTETNFRTGSSEFVAVFNENFRVLISEAAAKALLKEIQSGEMERADYSKPPIREEAYGGKLEDTPSSVYDEDTGVEQV